MYDGHIVYSNGNLTTANGEVSINQHTRSLHIVNKDISAWVEVKLNGGPHSVWIPPAPANNHNYVIIPGDYTKIEVVTAGSAIRVFAVG